MSETSIEGGMARLAALAAQGAARARAERRHVLVSVVERLPDLDALAEALAFTRSADARSAMAGDASCMYWEHPSARFALAGLGAARTLTASGNRRFSVIDEDWTQLTDGAMVDDPSGGTAGTGPTLLGGFAFDEAGPHTPLWKGFESAQLTLPRFLVATVGADHWLTTTIVVGPDGSLDVPLDRIAGARARIGHAARGERVTRRDERAGRIRWTDLRPAAEWRALVASAVDVIREGALEKVVLARAVRAKPGNRGEAFDLGSVLQHLRAAHPHSFVFACWRGERAFVGASPERLVRVDGREVVASSLAGSAERGATAEDDAWLAAQLIASPKDAGEHSIVLRALRDGLSELCDDVSSAAEPSLLTLRHVHHLHTVVRARLRSGRSLLELVGRLHPTPAVGGTPRDAALAFIRAHEQLDRGWYAAPVGWLQCDRGEFAVALRSGLVDGDGATLFAGCGVVHDSEPDLELAESVVKLRSMLTALSASEEVSGPAPVMADEGVTP